MFFKVKISVYMDFWISSVFSGVKIDECTLLQGKKRNTCLFVRYEELVHRNKYIPFVIHSSPKACEMMFWSSHIVNVNTLKWEKTHFSPQNNNWSKFWTLALQAALKWVYIIACNMSDFKTLLQWWWLY